MYAALLVSAALLVPAPSVTTATTGSVTVCAALKPAPLTVPAGPRSWSRILLLLAERRQLEQERLYVQCVLHSG